MKSPVAPSAQDSAAAGNLLGTEDVAARYGVPVATVRKWRHMGYGPKGFPCGKYVRYRLSDCIAWEESQLNPDSAA